MAKSKRKAGDWLMNIFKCENCGCLMMLNIRNLTEYLDRGTVSCPYCGANSEYLTEYANDDGKKE